MRGRKIKSSLSRGNSRRRVMNMKRLRTMRKNRNSRNLLKNRRVTRKNNSKARSRSRSKSRSRMSYRRKFNKRGGRSNRKRRNKRRSKQRGGFLEYSALPCVTPDNVGTNITNASGDVLKVGETDWESTKQFGKDSCIDLGSEKSGSRVLDLKMGESVKDEGILYKYLRTKPVSDPKVEDDLGEVIEGIIPSTKKDVNGELISYGIGSKDKKLNWNEGDDGDINFDNWYNANIKPLGNDKVGAIKLKQLTALARGLDKDSELSAGQATFATDMAASETADALVIGRKAESIMAKYPFKRDPNNVWDGTKYETSPEGVAAKKEHIVQLDQYEKLIEDYAAKQYKNSDGDDKDFPIFDNGLVTLQTGADKKPTWTKPGSG
jgi:hypothetical protein